MISRRNPPCCLITYCCDFFFPMKIKLTLFKFWICIRQWSSPYTFNKKCCFAVLYYSGQLYYYHLSPIFFFKTVFIWLIWDSFIKHYCEIWSKEQNLRRRRYPLTGLKKFFVIIFQSAATKRIKASTCISTNSV